MIASCKKEKLYLVRGAKRQRLLSPQKKSEEVEMDTLDAEDLRHKLQELFLKSNVQEVNTKIKS